MWISSYISVNRLEFLILFLISVLDEKLFSMGRNSFGQLGIETMNVKQFAPIEIKFESPISKIYVGGHSSFIFGYPEH